MFRSFVQRLESRLSKELPGEEAQFSMAPIARKRIAEVSKEKYNPKQSAVLILLFPEGESIHTVLIQRPEYEGVHSGQVAFPGGKFEESDLELQHTALREAKEEVGIHPPDIQIIGSLTELYITPSNFLVKPFIGILNSKPNFMKDEREVQKLFRLICLALMIKIELEKNQSNKVVATK